MKIAFGLDGTLWSYQNAFKSLQRLLTISGHQVGILTSHKDAIQRADEKLLLQQGFSTFHFFINRTETNTLPEESIAIWKLRMMAEHDIQLLFDDSEDENDGVFQEFVNSGRVVHIMPRRPLSKHYL